MGVDRERRAVRPSVPPLLVLAAGLWAGSATACTLAPSLDASACVTIACVGVAAGLVLCAFLRFVQVRMLVLALVGIALGLSCGSVRMAQVLGEAETVAQIASGTYRFEVQADAREGDFGNSCTATLVGESVPRMKVSLRYPSDAGVLRYGDLVEAKVRFGTPAQQSRAYYLGQGIAVVATADAVSPLDRPDAIGALGAFRKTALSLFDGYTGSGAAFLRAILFGDRSELSASAWYQDVKAVGLAHIVAVSGAHLSVVSLLFGSLMGACAVPRRAIAVVQVLFIGAYLVCAGMPISGIRAALMTVVAIGAVFVRRRSSALAALAACIGCIIVATPESSVSISFALSAGATLGIVVFGSLVKGWWSQATGGRAGLLGDSVSLTVSSGIATTPLSAAVFSQVPLVGPLANAVATPFFAVFCGGGLLAVFVALLVPAWADGVLGLLVVSAQGFSEAVELLAQLPVASVPADAGMGWAIASSCIGFALLWVWWPEPKGATVRRAAVALALVAGIGLFLVPPTFDDEIIMLDVGQGDAFVVRSRGAVILIDTGNQDTRLLAALARHGIRKLDAVVISHADDDHCGSLSALSGVVRIDSVQVASDLLTCPCASCTGLRETADRVVGRDRITGLAVGDRLAVGTFGLEVIWPDRFEDEGGNADSLTLKLARDADGDGEAEWTGLFCGDAELEELKAMMKLGRLDAVDVLKVGHHGSRAAIDEETAVALGPDIALVSAGENNRYGHPTPETLEALDVAGCRVFRTDQEGDVVCRIAEQDIAVTTLR